MNNISTLHSQEIYSRAIDGNKLIRIFYQNGSCFFFCFLGVVKIQSDLTCLPLFENNNKIFPAMNLLSHGHFVNYGGMIIIVVIIIIIIIIYLLGGYYSYLFARMYAAQIWNKQFKSQPLSRL